MTRAVDFTVVGEQKIHCAGCEARIGGALRRIPGVRHVAASAHTQRVVVTINPAQVTPEQVGAKLEELGYEVTPSGNSP
ncbi:MAG: heavy-metal-associated domain-containing protein [Armatimonadetes bacterium]|nr:heavy-metal-associated domain-containing protein [Armatimonadota bacterium]